MYTWEIVTDAGLFCDSFGRVRAPLGGAGGIELQRGAAGAEPAEAAAAAGRAGVRRDRHCGSPPRMLSACRPRRGLERQVFAYYRASTTQRRAERVLTLVDRRPATGFRRAQDVISTNGVRRAGSRILGNYVPSSLDRCRAAPRGAAARQTNTDEFAMGSSTGNSPTGRRGIHGTHARPGGSGRSAAAVAAGLAPWALGSDTGSVKLPSAFARGNAYRPTARLAVRIVAFASASTRSGP
jgi:aspartyl-tRNA(Asn)/glutamyl-tRNA(Gln) amidotransferase subunit A